MSTWRVSIAVGRAAVAHVAVRSQRDLATDDRLHPGLGAGDGEFKRAEQVSAVGDRHRRHRFAAAQLHQLLDFDRAGRQRVGAVDAEMDEIGERHVGV